MLPLSWKIRSNGLTWAMNPNVPAPVARYTLKYLKLPIGAPLYDQVTLMPVTEPPVVTDDWPLLPPAPNGRTGDSFPIKSTPVSAYTYWVEADRFAPIDGALPAFTAAPNP